MNKILLIVILTIIFITVIILHQVWKPSSDSGHADITDPYNYPFVLEKLLTPEQCEQIINRARDNLVESEIISGNMKSIRDSSQNWIPKTDLVVKPIVDTISKAFGIPVANAEDIQVVRYLPDQYYNEHHDSCCDRNEKCDQFVKRGGQRILTVLIYLNSEFENGGTYFKNLNLTLKPPAGDAIVFFPLATNKNKCHPLALHAGLPVTPRGEKWIANLWFREREFH